MTEQQGLSGLCTELLFWLFSSEIIAMVFPSPQDGYRTGALCSSIFCFINLGSRLWLFYYIISSYYSNKYCVLLILARTDTGWQWSYTTTNKSKNHPVIYLFEKIVMFLHMWLEVDGAFLLIPCCHLTIVWPLTSHSFLFLLTSENSGCDMRRVQWSGWREDFIFLSPEWQD